MTRLLKITDLGSGIMVQGTNNVLYPDNATLTYPYNSIIVITDESNIATFRSAINNDVLFSGLIGKIEIGGEIVTKENINTKFDAIANKESGGGGDVTGLFADASYDSQTKRINFYDNGGNIVSYIDATDFIKDGMVSNVAISEGNLVITFNTDAGQEPISIALTDIFNSENYYNKTEVDGKLALKADKTELPDVSTFATKTEVNAAVSAINSKDEAQDAEIALKAVKADVDAALALKADKTEIPDVSTFATKEEVNAAVSAINTKNSEQDAEIALKAVKADVDAALALKADKSEIPDTSEFITKDEYNPKELATAKALTQLNETKADKTEIPDVSTFATKTELNAKANTADLAAVATSGSYNDLNDKPSIPDTTNLATKSELNAKQDALVSGTNIKTINGDSLLGEGNITIGGGGTINIDQSVISGSSNAVSGGAVYTQMGGLKLEKITQSAYDALATKDADTLYIING